MNSLFNLSFIFVKIPLVLVCLMGIISLQISQISRQSQKADQEVYQQQEEQEKFELNLIKKLPTLGLENLVADWFYLRFIQYFGDSNARDSVGYSLSPDYFTVIVNHDPKFVEAILKLDTSTSLFAGVPKQSIALLNQSLASMPSKFISIPTPPYYVWTFKGIDELLFLGKPLKAKQSYSTAVQWAKEYPSEASQRFIEITNQTINFLEKNPSSKVAQIGSWAAILGNAMDKKTTERAIKEIKSLGGKVFLDEQGRLSVRVPPNIN